MSKPAKIVLVVLGVIFLVALYAAWEIFTPGSSAVPTSAPTAK